MFLHENYIFRSYTDIVCFWCQWDILPGQCKLPCIYFQQVGNIDWKTNSVQMDLGFWLAEYFAKHEYIKLNYLHSSILNIKRNHYLGNSLSLARTKGSHFSLRLEMMHFTFLLSICYLFRCYGALQYRMYRVEAIKMFVQSINELWTNINRTTTATRRAVIGPVTQHLLP